MDRIVQCIQPTLHQLPKRKRVAAYARVSNDDDGMLHSLEAQVSYYRRIIQEHGDWIYGGVYADEGISGTKSNRPAFQRMLSDCYAGKIDMIITKSVTRFYRNTLPSLETIRNLKDIGVDIFFEKENIHTLSSDGELLITLLASIAQEESRSASENQKWRIRKAYEKREFMTLNLIYGYTVIDGSIKVNEEQANIVREIFTRFVFGDTMQSIMRDLNTRKVPSYFAKKWTNNAIRRILSNEKYIGDAILQKTFLNNHLEKKEVINNGELPKYYLSGTHEAIIDRDTFQKAQDKLLAITVSTRGWKPREPGPFHSMIRCVHCGSNYQSVTTNGTQGFNCPTYTHYGKSHCFGKKIPYSTLVDTTTDVLGLKSFDEKVFKNTVSFIEVPAPNHLRYVFKDGHQEERIWHDRSRKDSWTPEMREAAKQRTIRQHKEAIHENHT